MSVLTGLGRGLAAADPGTVRSIPNSGLEVPAVMDTKTMAGVEVERRAERLLVRATDYFDSTAADRGEATEALLALVAHGIRGGTSFETLLRCS